MAKENEDQDEEDQSIVAGFDIEVIVNNLEYFILILHHFQYPDQLRKFYQLIQP